MRTIDHLSAETLLAIFDFATAPNFPCKSWTRDFHHVVLLSHVSRHWREILLNYDRVWSDIHISGQDIDMVDAQIKRCKSTSLHVSIRNPNALRRRRDPSESLKNIRKAANLIRERRNQVTRLEVHLGCWSFQKYLGFEWPNLLKFKWTDTCFEDLPHQDSYDGGLPRLRELSLKGGFNWPMTVVEHLTTFKLQGPADLELLVFAEFFRRNTSLESLNLIDVHVRVPPGYRQEKFIKLPHLKELSIKVCSAMRGRPLSLLDLPSLERLSVFSKGGQNLLSELPSSKFCSGLSFTSLEESIWSEFSFSEFCSRLSFTNLEAEYLPSSYGSITVVGSDESGVQPLRFTEFSYENMGSAFFRSLSNHSLSSVTSFSFITGMPQGVMTEEQVLAICNLLKHLSGVESMHLCPTLLTIRVLRRLRGDSKLCPGLKELGATATIETCEMVLNLGCEVLRSRGGCDDRWGVRLAERPYPEGPHGTELEGKILWEKANSSEAWVADDS